MPLSNSITWHLIVLDSCSNIKKTQHVFYFRPEALVNLHYTFELVYSWKLFK